jgi:anaerobic glycerol-3-phosphate dehydrogenase
MGAGSSLQVGIFHPESKIYEPLYHCVFNQISVEYQWYKTEALDTWHS